MRPRFQSGCRLRGSAKYKGKLGGSAVALLFLHVTLAPGAAVPTRLSHRVTVHADAAPPGQQEITESGGEVAVDRRAVVSRSDQPLRGERYVSADSCCDASRHTRTALPVNGRVWLAQRLRRMRLKTDGQGQIYNGRQEARAIRSSESPYLQSPTLLLCR